MAFYNLMIWKLLNVLKVNILLYTSTMYILDDELKIFLQFLLTNDKFKPSNHKKLICFTLVCLWNVQTA